MYQRDPYSPGRADLAIVEKQQTAELNIFEKVKKRKISPQSRAALQRVCQRRSDDKGLDRSAAGRSSHRATDFTFASCVGFGSFVKAVSRTSFQNPGPPPTSSPRPRTPGGS